MGRSLPLANCIFWDHMTPAKEQIAVTGTTANPAELIVEFCDVPLGVKGVISKGTVTLIWGGGNIDADPRFQNPVGPDRVAGTKDDDLHVQAGSPCVDAGDNTAVPADTDDLDLDDDRLERIPFDLDGRPRFVDHPATADTGWADAPAYPKIVDLGAYELDDTPPF